MRLSAFPAYETHDPAVPVWCVTPGTGRTIHRFFDTSPFSPSGRYLALFRMPFEDRVPRPGERGEVVLVDLASGEERVLAETRGWESQVGANVQWGASDGELFFNDVDQTDWRPFAVRLRPATGERTRLEGGVFMASPSGDRLATTCPLRARRTQAGYGVVAPDDAVPVNGPFPDDNGLYVTNVATGASQVLVSIAALVEALHAQGAIRADDYRAGQSYGFQCKWNPQGTRLLMVWRWLADDGSPRRNHVVTMRSDGGDIRLAIPAAEWAKGGHHINWHPDGERLTMNLNLGGDGLRFVEVRHDGTGLRPLLERTPGSGHPSVHASGRFILTDAYLEDTVAYGDGTVPLRLVRLSDGSEERLARVQVAQPYGKDLRVDPHPAWDYSHTLVAFNGYVGGTRRVFVGDVSALLKEGK